jgi:hypothetical protein
MSIVIIDTTYVNVLMQIIGTKCFSMRAIVINDFNLKTSQVCIMHICDVCIY